MMNLTPTRISILSLLFTGSVALSAQTAAPAAKPPVHRAATTTAASTAAKPASTSLCATDLPVLSTKIPALPDGSSCVKTLYTVTATPAVKLENVSPLESAADVRATLGLEPSSFSLLYVDTKIGTGPLAQPHKWYTIHYTGYLLDGTKFDSSVDRGEPISINYGQHMVIPGWDTGFGGMHVGGKRRLYIPFQLAYGAQAKGPIPARSPLIFDVELIAQSDAQPLPTSKPAAAGAPATPPATKPATAAPDAAPAPATQPNTTPQP